MSKEPSVVVVNYDEQSEKNYDEEKSPKKLMSWVSLHSVLPLRFFITLSYNTFIDHRIEVLNTYFSIVLITIIKIIYEFEKSRPS